MEIDAPGRGWLRGLAAVGGTREGAPMPRMSTGMLNDEIPYLAIGNGPPLVTAMGLTATHEVPNGMERRMVLRGAMPLCDDFRVYVVNQKPGLRLRESTSEIAGYLATAIETEFGEPVLLTGTGTGGSVALQLAVDRPELVRALVVAASSRVGATAARRSACLRCPAGPSFVPGPMPMPVPC